MLLDLDHVEECAHVPLHVVHVPHVHAQARRVSKPAIRFIQYRDEKEQFMTEMRKYNLPYATDLTSVPYHLINKHRGLDIRTVHLKEMTRQSLVADKM